MRYTKVEREQKRIKFAKKRKQGHSLDVACTAAGISTSTFYAWNSDDDWSKDGGWSKDNGGSKDDV